jgi:hypothetical protein
MQDVNHSFFLKKKNNKCFIDHLIVAIYLIKNENNETIMGKRKNPS